MKAFRFGCTAPSEEGLADALRQNRLRNQLWNALVELELARRVAVENLLPEDCRRLTDEADRALSKEERAARRDRRKAAFADPVIAEGTARLWQEMRDAARPLYRGGELYSWNVDDVLTDWRAACSKAAPPRFHRHNDREGVLALRWQTGLPVADAFEGEDLRLRLSAPPEEGSRRARRFGGYAFRIGTRGRAPVWADGGLVLHRPLPPESTIRKAYLKWGRIGGHVRWWLVLIVNGERTPSLPRRGRVALDLGWRQVDNGLRVAAWIGDDSAMGRLVLPSDWLGEMDRVERIRAHRDRGFNVAREALAARLAAEWTLPEWFAERTRTLRQWRSPARLAALALAWRAQRFDGDEEAYAAVEQWRVRDRHLWEFEAHLREQLLARRLHLYREFAAALARRYGECLLEKMDLRTFARLDKAGGDMVEQMRSQRTRAALSELRAVLRSTFAREGGSVYDVPAQNTTRTCYWCGTREVEWDAARHIEHTCGGCGRTWDQDDNAARWILRGGVPQTSESKP